MTRPAMSDIYNADCHALESAAGQIGYIQLVKGALFDVMPNGTTRPVRGFGLYVNGERLGVFRRLSDLTRTANARNISLQGK